MPTTATAARAPAARARAPIYLVVPGPLPGGALAAACMIRGALTVVLDGGAHPGAATIAAGELEAALDLRAR